MISTARRSWRVPPRRPQGQRRFPRCAAAAVTTRLGRKESDNPSPTTDAAAPPRSEQIPPRAHVRPLGER